MVRNIIITESQLETLYKTINEEITGLDGSDSTRMGGPDRIGLGCPIEDPEGKLDQDKEKDMVGSDKYAQILNPIGPEGIGRSY